MESLLTFLIPSECSMLAIGKTHLNCLMLAFSYLKNKTIAAIMVGRIRKNIFLLYCIAWMLKSA